MLRIIRAMNPGFHRVYYQRSITVRWTFKSRLEESFHTVDAFESDLLAHKSSERHEFHSGSCPSLEERSNILGCRHL